MSSRDLSKIMEREMLHSEHAAQCVLEARRRDSAKARCWCRTCRPVRPEPPEDMRMVLCPDCGNKRCPKATDHRNACTGSNAPGQAASWYA